MTQGRDRGRWQKRGGRRRLPIRFGSGRSVGHLGTERRRVLTVGIMRRDVAYALQQYGYTEESRRVFEGEVSQRDLLEMVQELGLVGVLESLEESLMRTARAVAEELQR